jgi:hypothetical protein
VSGFYKNFEAFEDIFGEKEASIRNLDFVFKDYEAF